VQTQAKETRIKKKMAMTSDSDNNSHEKKKISCNHPYTNTTEDREKKESTPANAGKIVKSYNGSKNKPRKRTTKIKT
jgi:hypothetical protein